MLFPASGKTIADRLHVGSTFRMVDNDLLNLYVVVRVVSARDTCRHKAHVIAMWLFEGANYEAFATFFFKAIYFVPDTLVPAEVLFDVPPMEIRGTPWTRFDMYDSDHNCILVKDDSSVRTPMWLWHPFLGSRYPKLWYVRNKNGKFTTTFSSKAQYTKKYIQSLKVRFAAFALTFRFFDIPSILILESIVS